MNLRGRRRRKRAKHYIARHYMPTVYGLNNISQYHEHRLVLIYFNSMMTNPYLEAEANLLAVYITVQDQERVTQ